jgi:uncharacterized protein (DUF433 family)
MHRLGNHFETYSLKESAALAELSERTLRNEVDRGVIKPQRNARGRRRDLRLPVEAILYLMLIRETPFALTRSERAELYRLLVSGESRRGDWRAAGDSIKSGIVTIDAGAPRRRLAERLRIYRRGLGRLAVSPDILGGEPVFAGTRIAIRHVGRLALRGVETAEILGDYPDLTADDIAFARIYAAMKAEPGRPRKRLRFRALAA